MLDLIRKKRNSVVVLLAFGIIILVFIFWGVNPGGDQGGRRIIATVNGETISAEQYNDHYRKQVEYLRETFKEQFTPDFIEKMDLRRRTINMLVNRILIVNAAKVAGVSVSDEELSSAIVSMPAFQADGVFDKKRYFSVITRNRMNPGEFEEALRLDLLTERMRQMTVKDIAAEEEEVRTAYSKENRQISLEYMEVPPERFMKSVEVSDEELRKHYDENRFVLMEPVRVKAVYASVDIKERAQGIEVPEEDVKDYYEANIMEFQMPRRVRARHILIRPDQVKGDAKKKAEGILKRARRGENFAGLAKKYSHDVASGKQGGDLGYFAAGTMVKSFEQAAFALDKGDISGVVESEFGYHIIKVEDIKEAGLAPLKEARKEIKEVLSVAEAEVQAREQLESFKVKFADKETPVEFEGEAVAKGGLRLARTGSFSETDSGAELNSDEALREAAFSLEAGGVSEIVDTPEKFYVIKIIERVEEYLPELDAIKDKIDKAVREKKAKAAAEAEAIGFVERLKKGETLKALAKADGYKLKTSGFFRLVDGFIPDAGVFVGDREDLFAMPKDSPALPVIIPHTEGFFIVRVKDAKEADEKGFDKEKDEIGRRLLRQKQEEALAKWVEGLRSGSSIEINEEML